MTARIRHASTFHSRSHELSKTSNVNTAAAAAELAADSNIFADALEIVSPTFVNIHAHF